MPTFPVHFQPQGAPQRITYMSSLSAWRLSFSSPDALVPVKTVRLSTVSVLPSAACREVFSSQVSTEEGSLTRLRWVPSVVGCIPVLHCIDLRLPHCGALSWPTMGLPTRGLSKEGPRPLLASGASALLRFVRK